MYAGADWIARLLEKDLSPLGREVADLLGDVFRGIYHLSHRALHKVEWSNPHCIRIVLGNYLATWDSNELTLLVVLSHDRMIRIELRGVGPGYTEITFHKRKTREGLLMERLPTMERHIKLIRNQFEKADTEKE
jgi:hypothetical protein